MAWKKQRGFNPRVPSGFYDRKENTQFTKIAIHINEGNCNTAYTSQ